MAAKVGDFSLILKLLGGIIIGALLGLYIGENAEGSLKHVMDVVVSLRHIFGQIIFFLVPLVIVGFITPAIVRLGQNASKILLVAVALAYVSSLGAALFSMISGYCIIPNLSIATSTETLRSLPEMVFRLDIPPLFSVDSAREKLRPGGGIFLAPEDCTICKRITKAGRSPLFFMPGGRRSPDMSPDPARLFFSCVGRRGQPHAATNGFYNSMWPAPGRPGLPSVPGTVQAAGSPGGAGCAG